MNPKSYGKKCKYGHHESEHIAKMKRLDEPSTLQAKTLYGVLPLMNSNLEHGDCKVCECIKLNTEKKCWGF